tara:strand:+ start:242 stop:403 length:162 start_codon:yes stop_codon:yes gene_type:complete
MKRVLMEKSKYYKPILKQILHKSGVKCVVYDNKFFAYGELYPKNEKAAEPKQK